MGRPAPHHLSGSPYVCAVLPPATHVSGPFGPQLSLLHATSTRLVILALHRVTLGG